MCGGNNAKRQMNPREWWKNPDKQTNGLRVNMSLHKTRHPKPLLRVCSGFTYAKYPVHFHGRCWGRWLHSTFLLQRRNTGGGEILASLSALSNVSFQVLCLIRVGRQKAKARCGGSCSVRDSSHPASWCLLRRNLEKPTAACAAIAGPLGNGLLLVPSWHLSYKIAGKAWSAFLMCFVSHVSSVPQISGCAGRQGGQHHWMWGGVICFVMCLLQCISQHGIFYTAAI